MIRKIHPTIKMVGFLLHDYKISVAKKGKPSKIKGIPKNPKSVQKMVNTKKRLFKEGKLKVWNEGLKGKEYEKHYPNGWKGGRPRD